MEHRCLEGSNGGERLVDNERGPGSRNRLLAGRFTCLRFLWWGSKREELVWQFSGRAQCSNWQTEMVLPIGPSRSLGLRPASAAVADHSSTRKYFDSSSRSGYEDGVCFCLQPRDWKAFVPDRGATCSPEQCSR